MSRKQPKTSPLPPRRVISMRWIITFSAIALICISVAGVSWFSERNARATLTAEVETRLLLEARILALLSSDALLRDYPELVLFPVVSDLQSQRPDLAFVVVVDLEGTIHGHADARMLGQRFELAKSLSPKNAPQELNAGEAILGDEQLLVAAVPASHAGDQTLGMAYVGLNLSYLEGLVKRARRDVIPFTAALLAVGMIAALLLISFLLRPIDALRAGLERIGRGDLETPMQLKDRTELGLLADTVNDMSLQLKISRQIAQAREQEIIETQTEVIHTLGEVVENRSHETGSHIVRVGEYSNLLARLCGADEEEAEILELASPMHDVGKIGIPDNILNKPGKFTDDEYELMKSHTTIGYKILCRSKRAILKAGAIIAHQHHERWDGKGYPCGLQRDEIHLYGRIVALVDVFDALSSDRVYRKGMPLERVLDIIRQGRGSHFDPSLVDLFLANLEKFLAIQDRHAAKNAAEIRQTKAKVMPAAKPATVPV